MDISIAQVRSVMEIIESGDGDGWYCWEELKKWLTKFEAAQPSVQATGETCPHKNGLTYQRNGVWYCGLCNLPRA